MTEFKPKRGERGVYHSPINGKTNFTVDRVDGAICHVTYHYPTGDTVSSFIWRFFDGLNQLHHWPSKAPTE